MTKKKSSIFIIFILCILFAGCGEEKNAYTKVTNKEPESKNVEWQKCYITFLEEALINKDREDVIEFKIKDLDNNGISEIIIAQNGVDISVYTFDSNDFKIYEVGNCNYGGTTRLFFSNDSSYPGIFYFHVGGGLEHHGYMTIKENSLIKEELWNYDYSGISEEIGEKRDKTLEISLDKQLIDESKEVFSQNQDLLFEEINLENIEHEIMGDSPTPTQQPEESKENMEPKIEEIGGIYGKWKILDMVGHGYIFGEFSMEDYVGGVVTIDKDYMECDLSMGKFRLENPEYKLTKQSEDEFLLENKVTVENIFGFKPDKIQMVEVSYDYDDGIWDGFELFWIRDETHLVFCGPVYFLAEKVE